MFIQFMMNESQYRNEAAKILYASSFLKESALEWIQSRLDDYIINPHSEREEKTQQIFHHFENFVVKLKRIFKDSEEEAITRRKLLKFKQLSSVITYASQFQTLAYKLNWNENMLIAKFLKGLRKNIYMAMTPISQSETLVETIIIATRIDNRLYQVRTNNRYSETQKSIASNTQKGDSINLDANEIDRRKCYNYGKKSHIAKRCKKSKSIQQLDILKEDLNEKTRKHSWERKTKAQVLKENEQENNFEDDLRYERKCVFFTTCIYRLLHSMTLVIDRKTERIKDRSTFDQKNFMLKFIRTRYFLKEEQSMCYLTSEKDSEYIYKELKKHNETSDACESLKEFKNTNEVREFYEQVMKINKIQSFKCNEHRWKDIARTIKTCQKHEIESGYTGIDNEDTIILYDSKSAVNYISWGCELRLKALRETSVVNKNDKNIITILECDDLLNMIFRRKRNSTNYLVISAAHSIKSSLNTLKEDDDLKEKELGSYTSIRPTHIMRVILCNRRVVTVIHRGHKGSYITRSLWKNIFLDKISHFNGIIELISPNRFKWKETIMIKESQRKYVVITISAIHRTKSRYHSMTIAFLTYFNYWRKQVLWRSEIIEQQMIELDIAIRFRERIKETELWQKYNVIMIQKAKDSNVILKWYYTYLIYFSDKEDGSASADNEENSKNSEKKDVTTGNENFSQESASSLQSKLSTLTKISMKQNAQNRENIESWDFLDLNSDYLAD